MNVTQTAEFEKVIGTTRVQTLLRESHLYDLVSGRSLNMSEYWLIQGFPHPGCNLPIELVARFPFPEFVQGLFAANIDEQRELLGNSMHVSSISAWILYSFATSRALHSMVPARSATAIVAVDE